MLFGIPHSSAGPSPESTAACGLAAIGTPNTAELKEIVKPSTWNEAVAARDYSSVSTVPILLATIAAFNQLSGINAVLYYLTIFCRGRV